MNQDSSNDLPVQPEDRQSPTSENHFRGVAISFLRELEKQVQLLRDLLPSGGKLIDQLMIKVAIAIDPDSSSSFGLPDSPVNTKVDAILCDVARLFYGLPFGILQERPPHGKKEWRILDCLKSSASIIADLAQEVDMLPKAIEAARLQLQIVHLIDRNDYEKLVAHQQLARSLKAADENFAAAHHYLAAAFLIDQLTSLSGEQANVKASINSALIAECWIAEAQRCPPGNYRKQLLGFASQSISLASQLAGDDSEAKETIERANSQLQLSSDGHH
jgi:hypothetical protein